MKTEKSLSIFFVAIFVVGIFFVTFNAVKVSAVGEAYWCAERTVSGAWCQNVPISQVDNKFRKAQTNCESTSFCKTGTCVDAKKGQCRPNVPQRVCQQTNGVWIEGKPDTIQQCQVGCCIAGDQAAFVTQTACRGIGSDYGISTEFRADIKDFTQCLALSNPSSKGACVIDDGFQRDCRILAKKDCDKLKTSGNTTVEFNPGLLCTAEVLATRCAPTEKTTCVDGKYGVYFVDSCGNPSNIYDASKVKDREYWTNLKEPAESCNPSSSNAGSKTCGNCDYLTGSICKPSQRGNSATPQPQYGSYVCADLSCDYKGQTYKHGEEWCGTSPGVDKNLPGSEYYYLSCYNGEVTVNACDSFRQTICVQGTSNEGYKTAACVKNLWESCRDQKSKVDCENTDKRDCVWIEGQSLLGDDKGYFVLNEEGKLVSRNQTSGSTQAACVPKYPSGFAFWDNATTLPAGVQDLTGGTELCLLANANCLVKFKKKNALDDWDCKENCNCLSPNWAKERMNLCLALGDCGVKNNWVGAKGYHNDGFISVVGGHVPGAGTNAEIKSRLEKGATS